MPYAWREEADKEGQQTAKLPRGEHDVRISKIVYGTRHGPFTSQSGDPQIMPIFQDREAREAGMMITLSHRAGFILAKLMSCCDPPVNLERMEQDGVEPHHFANPEFAERVLVNRGLRVHVDYEAGQDGKEYPRVTPVKRQATSSPSTPYSPPSAPYTPPAAASPPPVSSPPPTEAPPASTELTKDQAWQQVMAAWTTVTGVDAQQRRNQAWIDAIRAQCKPEPEFTGVDWAKVVELCSTPF